MGIFKKDWQIRTSGKGTYEITSVVAEALNDSGFSDGLFQFLLSIQVVV